jgi:hypothetical protein
MNTNTEAPHYAVFLQPPDFSISQASLNNQRINIRFIAISECSGNKFCVPLTIYKMPLFIVNITTV